MRSELARAADLSGWKSIWIRCRKQSSLKQRPYRRSGSSSGEHERALVFELQRKSRTVSLLLTGSFTPGTRAHLTPGWPPLICNLLIYVWGRKCAPSLQEKIGLHWFYRRMREGFTAGQTAHPARLLRSLHRTSTLIHPPDLKAQIYISAAEWWPNLFPVSSPLDPIWPLTSLWPAGCFSRIFRV